MRRSLIALMWITGILLVIGLIFVYSTSAFFALSKYNCTTFYFKRQLVGAALCIAAAIFISLLPSRVLYEYAASLFFVTLFLCLLTRVPKIGVTINGARRWLRLPVGVFQPVELLKPAAVLFFSKLLNKGQFAINRMWLTFVLLVAVCVGVLLIQPDFGQSMVLGATALSLLFIARCELKTFIRLLGFCVCMVSGLIATKSYRLRRLLIFLNPWKDPQGGGFQIIQSLIAIANGGWIGLGIGKSKQKLFYLPMQHTDFIFSIICEEVGTIGGLCIVVLYGCFFLCVLRLAYVQENLFESLVLAGCGIIIFLQASINILVTLGAIPTKGIGLPFISYGMSSLLGMGLLVGLIFNIAITSSTQRTTKRFFL